jgi:hypothetical protein
LQTDHGSASAKTLYLHFECATTARTLCHVAFECARPIESDETARRAAVDSSCGRAIGMAHAAWERRRDGFVRFDVGVGVGVGRAPGKSIAGPRPRPIGRQLARPGTVPTATSLWKPTATGRVRRVRDDGSASCVGPSSRSQPVARTWRRATCVVDGLHRCRAPIHRERADS